MTTDVEALRQVHFFEELTDDDLGRVAKIGQRRSFAAGETLVERDSDRGGLFVILSGTARVEVGGTTHDLGPGDFFGEIGVLEKELRTATVRATSPMRLIILSRWDLKRLERRDPSAFDQIRETLEARR
jgi:CRP-like cAMP-binding protein